MMLPLLIIDILNIPGSVSPIGIIIGFLLGILLIYTLSWGITAFLGQKFVFKTTTLIIALLVGIIGAVIGDEKAASKRPLTKDEIYRAKKIFGNSLDYTPIRIAHNTRLMNLGASRAPFYTIYLSKKMDFLSRNTPEGRYHDVLIHELVHVWQTQHGIGIVKKVITSLGFIFNKKKTYGYGKNEGLEKAIADKKNFRDFNTEQQGEILSNLYCFTYHKQKRKVTQDIICHEHFAKQVQFNNGYHIEIDTFPHLSTPLQRDSL